MLRLWLSASLPFLTALGALLAATSGCVGGKGAEDMAARPVQQKNPDPPGFAASWPTYTDPAEGFSLGHPEGFVIQPQDVSKLARFAPAPLASVFFMNPTMAAGDLAGVEPPDLEVRAYRAAAADSLESWLTSVGLASKESLKTARPFRNNSVTGLRVCASTMIAPGCSVYVLHRDRVYQLTPISREGEAMIETFALPVAPPGV